MANSHWFKLPCKRQDIQLMGTLNGGQSFRWTKLQKTNEELWLGVYSSKVWLLQQTNEAILYQVFESNAQTQTESHYNSLLRQYLHLDIDLASHYTQWGEKDLNFKEAAKQFYGIRILRQEIVENIFSFICSQNNHISRITGMVEKLAKFYGNEICEVEGRTHYSFPDVEKLAGAEVEQTLKDNGFGYRAKYISRSAKLITDGGGQKWIDELRQLEYEEAKKRLMTLTGIGAKVADCICLMSLGHLQAIPVDTHIYQIAAKWYLPKLAKQKTVTEKIYKEIGDYFRELYGPLAGWAHTVLFCADLKKFQDGKGEAKSKEVSKSKRLKV
ncbi:N-glycosylase/DNA lyase [Euwallacea fornicatus]|uniref:N-glycosylase/DNA lyase n=1 Tax=Euwallacea fornicatus TaxID=995702 RepID=UPI00339012B5